MVKVVFLNLLRSKYGIDEILVLPGTVQNALDQIRIAHPQIQAKDFQEAVLYVNQTRVMHTNRFQQELLDGDEVILTHFVSGG
jgi:molybdopterin converting factor small subunit